jgi:hypothetical protein
MCLDEGSGHDCLCGSSVNESSIKALRTHQEVEIPGHVIYTFSPYSLQIAYKALPYALTLTKSTGHLDESIPPAALMTAHRRSYGKPPI